MMRAILLRLPPLGMAALLCAGPGTASAQTCPLAPGCTQTVRQTLPFATSNQSLWGPQGDESLLDGVTLSLFDQSWNQTGGDSSKQSFGGWFGTWTFGGSVSAQASGRVASFLDVSKFGEATVDVDYPVEVEVTVPEPNTFRPGDAVMIHTSWAPVADSVTLSADMWAADLALRGRFGMHNSASYDICLVSCSNNNAFFPTMSIPETGFSLFRSQGGSFGIGDEDVTDAASLLDFLASTATGVTAYVKAPDPLGTPSLAGTKVTAAGSDEWARLDVDVDGFLKFVKVIPPLPFPPLGTCLQLEGYGAFDLCYETADLDSQFRIFQDEDISFDASVQVRVDFPAPLGYDVVAPDETVTSSGVAASVSFPVGSSLRVFTPATVDPVALSPTFALENTVHRDSDLRIKYWVTNRELQLSFDMAQVSNSQSHDVDRGGWKRNCPSFEDDPVGWGECWALNLVELPQKWLKWVSNWVTETTTKTANAIDFDVGPLVSENFAETESTVPLLDRSWSLGGFDELAGQALTLDPENPGIAITTSVADAQYTTGAGSGTVLQTLTVTNTGDVPLALSEMLDALSAPGLTVEAVTSPDVTANPGFDGVSDTETMTSGDLPVGGSATVTVRMAAEAGLLHTADATTSASSPIGTLVNASAAASFAMFGMTTSPYVVEYEPGHRHDDGLKARVYSSDVLDVRRIDRGSLALEGVRPRRVKYKGGHRDDDDHHDHGRRPYLELTFRREAVVSALLARAAGQAQAAQTVSTVVALLGAGFEGTPDDVARSLLTGVPLAEADIRFLDEAGNANGGLDLGDLRALVMGDPVLVQTLGRRDKERTKGKKEKKKEKEKEERGHHRRPPTHTLVLTGTMDGIPLWAEAPIHLKIEEDD